MGQCIANMIKFSAELTIMVLCKGNIIDKTNVLGIVANYYESTGSVLNLEMNFTTGSCTIHYSVERLPLVYCLCKGNIIDKTNVLGIVANYYESTGSVLNLEMNFTTGSCTIHYSVERLPLVYCLNTACSSAVSVKCS